MPTGRRAGSTGGPSSPSARSGGSSTAGGPTSRSTGATSSSCWRPARTRSSTGTGRPADGSRSGPDRESAEGRGRGRRRGRGRGRGGAVGRRLRPAAAPARGARSVVGRPMGYVELHAHSAYSFLDGASLPEELAARAAELGYEALALTDHDGVYGSLEFAHACKHLGVRAITGAEVTLSGGVHVTLLCESARGYANLCRILTDAHARTRRPGRERELLPAETTDELVAAHAEGLVCLSGCARQGLGVLAPARAERLARAFPGAFYVELQRPYARGDARRNARLAELAAALGVPTVATGDVHAHRRRRARLQDVLVAIRSRASLDGSERGRHGSHEGVLLAPAAAAERLPRDAVARTREVAERR